MNNEHKPTKREAIEELRKEAEEMENRPTSSIKEYASLSYRAKMRRQLADKFERELEEEMQNSNE